MTLSTSNDPSTLWGVCGDSVSTSAMSERTGRTKGGIGGEAVLAEGRKTTAGGGTRGARWADSFVALTGGAAAADPVVKDPGATELVDGAARVAAGVRTDVDTWRPADAFDAIDVAGAAAACDPAVRKAERRGAGSAAGAFPPLLAPPLASAGAP